MHCALYKFVIFEIFVVEESIRNFSYNYFYGHSARNNTRWVPVILCNECVKWDGHGAPLVALTQSNSGFVEGRLHLGNKNKNYSNFGYIFTTDCTDYTDFSSQEATMADAVQSEWQEPPRLKNPYNPCNPLWKNTYEPLARRSQFFMNWSFGCFLQQRIFRIWRIYTMHNAPKGATNKNECWV